LLSGERGTWCVSQTGSEPDIQVQLFRDGTQVATLLHDDCSWPTAGMSTSGQTIDDGIGLTVFVSAPQDANRVERHSRGGTTSADVVHISTSGPGYAVLHVDYGDESGRLTTDTRQKPKLTPEMEEQLKEACSS
jgi:hypothetical protein